jgi:dTDP-4-amino-4,6-dideoxygalactose transaminase
VVKYPLFKVHIKKEEAMQAISSVFDSGFINEGEQVTQLTKYLSEFLNVRNLVLTNSCTSALTLALKVAGVGIGDEVATISMTCVATNTPIANLGAKIVWIDIDPESGAIDTEDLEKKITDQTKAIVFVNWAGNPCQLDELQRIAITRKIPLIQDAAHSFSAEWDGKPISEYADFTCFSFQAIKHFTTGDGGAIVCRKFEDFELVKKLKWFGYDRDAVKNDKGEWKGQRWDADIYPESIGYKFNMNNIAAAIGISQMPYARQIVEKHRQNADFYRNYFSTASKLKLLHSDKRAKSSNWVFTLRYLGNSSKRDLLLEKLIENGIGAGLVHLPNHNYTAFRGSRVKLPGTDHFAKSQVSLPCGWWLDLTDCEFIAEKVVSLSKQI